MQVRAWREVPLKSTSRRSSRLVIADLHPVLLAVVDAVAVAHVPALPAAVGQLGEGLGDALGVGVADVVDRAAQRLGAVALGALDDQPLAEVQAGDDRLHVGEEDLAEAHVVEDQAPGLAHGLAGAEQGARRQHEAVLVDGALGAAEAAGHRAAHVQLVGLEVGEGEDLAVVEHGAHEEHVVDVRAGPVGVVGDDDVAGLQALGPVLLDRVAHRVGHRAGEEHDAVAHRRRRVVRRRRAGDRAGEVVEVAQDRRERRRQQTAAHVLDDVVEAVGQHGRGEAVAAVALGELRRRRGRGSCAPLDRDLAEAPDLGDLAGMTTVVDSASRMIAGPCDDRADRQALALVLAGLQRRGGEVAQLDGARRRRAPAR